MALPYRTFNTSLCLGWEDNRQHAGHSEPCCLCIPVLQSSLCFFTTLSPLAALYSFLIWVLFSSSEPSFPSVVVPFINILFFRFHSECRTFGLPSKGRKLGIAVPLLEYHVPYSSGISQQVSQSIYLVFVDTNSFVWLYKSRCLSCSLFWSQCLTSYVEHAWYCLWTLNLGDVVSLRFAAQASMHSTEVVSTDISDK